LLLVATVGGFAASRNSLAIEQNPDADATRAAFTG
jgi:hypothetical protein